MQNEWILDVLTDLKTFATANGMSALAEQLDDATLVAAAEIASRTEATRGPRHDGDEDPVERYSGGTGRHRHA